MNPHGPMAQRILSPLRLPFRHPGRVSATIFAFANGRARPAAGRRSALPPTPDPAEAD